jgi:hypothetical protein
MQSLRLFTFTSQATIPILNWYYNTLAGGFGDPETGGCTLGGGFCFFKSLRKIIRQLMPDRSISS